MQEGTMIEKKVTIEQLDEGMLISADVHNSNGVVIVPAKTDIPLWRSWWGKNPMNRSFP